MIITVAAGATNSGFTGTTAPVIQNLGPGDLYVSDTNTDVTTRGLYLPPYAVYEFPQVVVEGPGAIWLQALGGNCDVRIINVG
jgi:hypothetical protein